MITARIVELAAPRQLRWREERLDPAALPSGAVLCETLASVISPGTELAAYTGLPPLRPGPAYPRLQGYCNVARVVAVGPGVRQLAVGDRVLSFSSHRSHFVLPEDDALLTLPDGLPAADGACAYLYHLGYNAVLRAGVRSGSQVLVVGLGALGTASVAMASLAGADVVALSDHGAAHGRAAGARAVVARTDAKALHEALPRGADVVVLTTNAWPDWQRALEAAAVRGTIAVLGFPGRGQPAPATNPLEPAHFYAKQLRVEAMGHSPERPDARGFNRYNERDNLRWIVSRLQAGAPAASLLLSGVVDAEHIEQAYADLLGRRGGALTLGLRWTRD